MTKQTMITKVGYTPILRGEEYGSRTLDMEGDPSLFESEDECGDSFPVGEEGCVAIAKVIWMEPA